ncbi:MAG: TetR/AcrR family transcriptional regulator [bacterium]|nr:TetR/AcrR family transcriptional regulator [bacterium]
MTSKKEKTDKAIIDAAVEVFINSGLEKATMGDIADRAGITRRTLYRYYASKEVLALAVEIQVFQKIITVVKSLNKTTSGNGFEKLKQFFDNYIGLIDSFKKEIRFTGEFDNYFTGGYPDKEFSNKLKNLLKPAETLVVAIIKEGISDGSVKRDLDAVLTYYVLSNAYLSIAQRIVIRGKLMKKEQGVEPSAILTSFHEMVMSGIKG